MKVNGKDDIPYMNEMENNPAMFETTKQFESSCFIFGPCNFPKNNQ